MKNIKVCKSLVSFIHFSFGPNIFYFSYVKDAKILREFPLPFLNVLNVYLFICLFWDREREIAQGRRRERGRERNPTSPDSTEPHVRLNLRNREIVTWAEIKSRTLNPLSNRWAYFLSVSILMVGNLYIHKENKHLTIYIYAMGAWVAQLIKLLTLNFSSGHDLTVHSLSPVWSSVLIEWGQLGILSLSAPPLLMLSFKINK